MSLEWIHENPARWDESKTSIVGGSPKGVFAMPQYSPGDIVPGDWWRVQDGDAVVGYGWMDCTWGDAEVLLAVDPSRRGTGVGTFIMDRLEAEAAARGLNYLYNVVRADHPERETVTDWLRKRRFDPSSDGLLKRRVQTEQT